MELKFVLESLLFSAQKPLSLKELRDVLTAAAELDGADATVKALEKVRDADLTGALEQLAQDHEAAGRSYRLVCVAGAWQFVTQPEYAPWLKALVGQKIRPPRLSQPALETLAIIAYRQPITRAEIEQIRGVNVDGVMQTLLERGLVEQVGRAEVVGRPMNYGVTVLFLEYFGLRSLEDLPAADELRRMVVQKPESLVTADPGLATSPRGVDASALARSSSSPTPRGEPPEPLKEDGGTQNAEATPANAPSAGPDAASPGNVATPPS